jgi:hypothetical protein
MVDIFSFFCILPVRGSRNAQHSTSSIEEIKKAATSVRFGVRFDRAAVPSYLCAARGTLISPKLQISRESACSGADFAPR